MHKTRLTLYRFNYLRNMDFFLHLKFWILKCAKEQQFQPIQKFSTYDLTTSKTKSNDADFQASLIFSQQHVHWPSSLVRQKCFFQSLASFLPSLSFFKESFRPPFLPWNSRKYVWYYNTAECTQRNKKIMQAIDTVAVTI